VAAQGFYRLSRRHPALVRRLLIAGMRRQLPAGFDVDRHFTPPYDPWDQRLCVAPDGDLFRAIRSGKASVVTDTIETFVAEGIRLASGEVLAADVVVTATGLELLFCGGIELRVDGEPIEPADRMVYRGAMLEGVPNLAVAIGYTNASWTLRCELTCRYVCRLLDHMRATGVRRATPRPASVEPSSEPLLGLNSGYVKRAVHLFPKQGSRPPWRLSQSFLDDWRSLHRTPVDDGHIVFGAGPVAEPSPVAEVAPVAGR
jgi:cation diffusion facilitator CzcD-associated flavoprotein CzcO